MDDNKQPQNPQQTVPVMDIQPPRPVQAEQVVTTSAPEEPVAPVPANQEHTPQSEDPDVASQADGNNDQTVPTLAIQEPAHKPHKGPILAIICAVIISGAFAALAVTMYVSGSDKEHANNSTPTTSDTNNAQSESVTSDDITETEKAIDDSLSAIDDSADYDESTVSDETLGL